MGISMSVTETDDVFDFIETHRAACVLSDRAGAEYNAATEEGGTLSDAMLAAVRIERRLFQSLLEAKPSTAEGMTTLIRYVHEVSRQQDERGHRDDSPEILIANLAA
jgi:hypothetical protein